MALDLTVHHQGTLHHFVLDAQASIVDLSERINSELGIPPSNQKLLISPRPGLLRPPFSPNLALAAVASRKITLLGSTPEQIAALNKRISSSQAEINRRPGAGPVKPAAPTRVRDWKTQQGNSTYTFLQIQPLPYLPHPERSRAFLERLRDDAGVQAAMLKHRFTVGLLTEMNPAEHTTHESRTLGLNRNRGEVIELRLRTDAYDGYRDYKTIRRTLAHELAHNVHSEHDRHFWDLCKQIEAEIERNDWRSGGRQVCENEIYIPEPKDDFIPDSAGWTGGEFVLGAGSVASPSSSSNGLSRREILARAAEERMKREKEAQASDPPP